MSSEELHRLRVLSDIRKHVIHLRPQLTAAGVHDLWHVDELERLLTEMFAKPGAENFRDLSLSFQWHVSFAMAEFEALLRERESSS